MIINLVDERSRYEPTPYSLLRIRCGRACLWLRSSVLSGLRPRYPGVHETPCPRQVDRNHALSTAFARRIKPGSWSRRQKGCRQFQAALITTRHNFDHRLHIALEQVLAPRTCQPLGKPAVIVSSNNFSQSHLFFTLSPAPSLLLRRPQQVALRGGFTLILTESERDIMASECYIHFWL